VQGRAGLGAAVKIEDAEAIVEWDLELMEPSYLEEKTPNADMMRKALYLAGLYVAHANNELHEKEIKALTALLGSDTMWNPPPPDKIKADLDAKLDEAKATATKLSRTQLVQHLTIVAAADGVVDQVELEAMYHVAGKLDVPAIVIDETLRAAAAPMD